MPGAGWNLTKTKKSSITIQNNQNIIFNDVFLQKGKEKKIMYYWFQGRGRFISSEYMQKFYLIIDSMTKHRTDEAFIRLLSPVINNDENKTRKNLTDFSKLLIPILQKYLPS